VRLQHFHGQTFFLVGNDPHAPIPGNLFWEVLAGTGDKHEVCWHMQLFLEHLHHLWRESFGVHSNLRNTMVNENILIGCW